MKFLYIAVLVIAAVRLLTGKWPWELFRSRQTHAQRLFHARQLLGVDANSTHAEIMEAHRRLMLTAHPDKGGNVVAVHEANAARDLLIAALPDKH